MPHTIKKMSLIGLILMIFTDELPPAALKSRLQDSQIEIILPQEDA